MKIGIGQDGIRYPKYIGIKFYVHLIFLDEFKFLARTDRLSQKRISNRKSLINEELELKEGHMILSIRV